MKKKGSIVVSILFLIWFFASIGGMFYCSRNGMQWLMITLFGQYFFVFGSVAAIAGIKEKKFQPMTLIFVMVGLGAMGCGLILQFGTKSMENMLEDLVPYLLLSIFVLAGVGMLAGGIMYYQKKTAACTYAVNAKVIDLKRRRYKGKTLFSPVYEYYYGGEYARYDSNMYTNIRVPQIGDYRELKINPSNPKEILEGNAAKVMLFFLVGLGSVFALAGIGGMAAVYFLA